MLKNFFLLILATLIFSCNLDPATEDGDENGNEGDATASISGTITLTNSAAWDNLKLGFFPKFVEVSEGVYKDYLEDTTVDSSFDRVDNTSYLYYNNNGDNSEVEVTPANLKDISDNTGTQQNYTFNLPEDPMQTVDESFYYSFAIWRDSDNDSKLDLNDISYFDRSEENAGEYSRLPMKLMNGTDLAVFHTFQYIDNDMGTGYKYSGYEGNSNNFSGMIADDSSGFDFTVDK